LNPYQTAVVVLVHAFDVLKHACGGISLESLALRL